METTAMLNSYISTRDSHFNRFALELYLANLECHAFPQHETALLIFKTIAIKMVENGGNFFSFVEEFEGYITQQSLTPPQQQLIYRIVTDYLKVSARKSFNPQYEAYYEAYLSYFKTLIQVTDHSNSQTILATKDIGGMLNDIVHRQMLKLSGDIDSIPVTQKAKVITALYKAMTITNKSQSSLTTGDNNNQRPIQPTENSSFTTSQL